MFHLYQQVRSKDHPEVRPEYRGAEGVIIAMRPQTFVHANCQVRFNGENRVTDCYFAFLEPIVKPLTPADIVEEETKVPAKV